MTDIEEEYILNELYNSRIDDAINVATDDVVWVRNDKEGITIDLTLSLKMEIQICSINTNVSTSLFFVTNFAFEFLNCIRLLFLLYL